MSPPPRRHSLPDPVLHLVAGPDGAGKSTFYERVLFPVLNLPFVNADNIAKALWPDDTVGHSYEAAQLAARERAEHIAQRSSFVAETVFSHASKIDLVEEATAAGFLVTLHVVVVPEALAVTRVIQRVRSGGHDVPEVKQRARYRRLWPLVARSVATVEEAVLYDNTSAAKPFRRVAEYRRGQLVRKVGLPDWFPVALRRPE